MKKKIKIVTQNCFFGRRIKQVIELIKSNPADVFCLQEVTSWRSAERIKKATGYKFILSKPSNKFLARIFFYNVIFSKLPIIDQGELNWLNKRRIPTGRFGGKALWAVLNKDGHKIRIYNCHFSPFGQGVAERKQMIIDIITDAKNFKGPVIISGDMNTVIPDRSALRWLVRLIQRFPPLPKNELGDFYEKNEKYFFLDTVRKYGFDELADINKNTWRFFITKREMFNLKLDWMLYRNCEKISYDLGNWIGDHKAIIGQLQI